MLRYPVQFLVMAFCFVLFPMEIQSAIQVIFKSKHEIISEQVFGGKFPVLLNLENTCSGLDI